LRTDLSEGRSSLVKSPIGEHTGDVSMYVTLLSGALDLFDTDLDDDALLDHVRECRAVLPAHDLGSGVWSETAVVVEIAYDRSLVCLAARCGVDVKPTNFVHPKIERDRLELELKRRGIDLGAPPYHRDGPEDA
jgi:hypothetical protein